MEKQSQVKKVGRFKRSMIITKETWSLFKQNSYFMMFPLASILAGLIVLGLAAVAVFYGALAGDIANYETISSSIDLESETVGWMIIIPIVLLGFIMALVGVFFQAGLTKAVYSELHGEKSSFSEGNKTAMKHIGRLSYWTLVTTTVGMVLRAIQEKAGILGKIFAGLGSVAWAVLSMFVVPVIILGSDSVHDSIKKSAKIFKDTWGESIVLNLSFGFVFGLIILLELLVGGVLMGLIATSSASLVPVLIVGGLMLVVIMITGFFQQTLTSIFKVVLYIYATTGIVPSGFSENIVKTSVKAKGKKK